MQTPAHSMQGVPRSRHDAPWRLHYYRDEYGNFGDDLNPWLWSRLLPGMLDERAPVGFIGIGTLLNASSLPAGPKLIVGSGCGYGATPTLTDDTEVLFVRGPKTARILGLPESMGITDPAYLASDFVSKVAQRRGTVYIPHHVSAYRADWRRVATAAGMTYVDPSSGWEPVVDAIRSAERVVTSAMHGAILADAFRVPWIRVQEYSHLNDFKWSDWADSVRVELRGRKLPALADQSYRSLGNTVARTMRAWKRKGRPYRTTALDMPTVTSDAADFERCVEILRPLASGGGETLSSDAVYADRMAKLRDAIQRLRQRAPTRA